MKISTDRQILIMGRILYFFAGWTLLIKFILPVAAAVQAGEPAMARIWWDFWWVAHLAVGYGLVQRRPGIFRWAMVLAVVETLIIGGKFMLFLPDPIVDVPHINWFVNKSFMLAYFLYSLHWLRKPSIREVLS